MYIVQAAQSRRNGTEEVGSAFGRDAELGPLPTPDGGRATDSRSQPHLPDHVWPRGRYLHSRRLASRGGDISLVQTTTGDLRGY